MVTGQTEAELSVGEPPRRRQNGCTARPRRTTPFIPVVPVETVEQGRQSVVAKEEGVRLGVGVS